jgi:glucokinase
MIRTGRAALGIDVGGTTYGVVLLDAEGRVADTLEDATPRGVPPALAVKSVAECARGLTERAGLTPRDLAGIGLAVPGSVDAERGVLRFSPNLAGWRDVPVAALAAEVLDAPVALEHDVRMAAFGESRRGAGAGASSFVCLTVGTGIGAAIVFDGRLYRGATDAAGEIGHVTVVPDGELCGCGRHGCLETVASGRAIAVRAGKPTAQDVFAAAAAGDARCAAIVAEAGAALASALTVLVNVLNPDVIAVGGGVATAGCALFDPLRAAVRAAAWAPGADAVRIVPAELGTRAGAIGAALFAAEARRGC